MFYIGKIFKVVNPSMKEPSYLSCQWSIHSAAVGVKIGPANVQTCCEFKSS